MTTLNATFFFFLSLHIFYYKIITMYYQTSFEKSLKTTLNATFFFPFHYTNFATKLRQFIIKLTLKKY